MHKFQVSTEGTLKRSQCTRKSPEGPARGRNIFVIHVQKHNRLSLTNPGRVAWARVRHSGTHGVIQGGFLSLRKSNNVYHRERGWA